MAFLALAAAVRGETPTQLDLRTQAKSVDFSSANTTRPFKSGTTLPAACSTGDMYFKTDAPSGANVYGCVAQNTWALESGARVSEVLSLTAGGLREARNPQIGIA